MRREFSDTIRLMGSFGKNGGKWWILHGFIWMKTFLKHPLSQHQNGIDYRNLSLLISNDFGKYLSKHFSYVSLEQKRRIG